MGQLTIVIDKPWYKRPLWEVGKSENQEWGGKQDKWSLLKSGKGFPNISRRFFSTQLVQNERRDKETFPLCQASWIHQSSLPLQKYLLECRCSVHEMHSNTKRPTLLSFAYFRFWKRKHFFSSCQVHLSGASPVCHFASIIDTTALPRACLQMFFKRLQMFEMFNKLIVYWLCSYHFQVSKGLSIWWKASI